jgi:glycosyltransferase involved in cell wall biosynthesis
MISAYRFLRGNHFDIIETFTHHPNMIILPLAWLAGIRVRIATHHGMFHGFGKNLIWLHASIINSRMVNSIVAVSEYVREQAECEGINSEKISVILNGVRVPIIDKKFAREKIRARLGINDKDPILLTVGRLQVEKGHDLLLQAAPLILDAEPRALFIFAGDGLLRNQLEMKATALGIANHIMFLGFRNDVPDLMAASDILLMPSRTEGMPNALLEAMSLGLPVVGFDVGGIGEAALNGKTSILVPPLGWQELASSVINLINDPEKCRQFGLASIQRINSEFTMDGMCMGYENIFGKIMKQI